MSLALSCRFCQHVCFKGRERFLTADALTPTRIVNTTACHTLASSVCHLQSLEDFFWLMGRIHGHNVVSSQATTRFGIAKA
jgi:hypothetical protein